MSKIVLLPSAPKGAPPAEVRPAGLPQLEPSEQLEVELKRLATISAELARARERASVANLRSISDLRETTRSADRCVRSSEFACFALCHNGLPRATEDQIATHLANRLVKPRAKGNELYLETLLDCLVIDVGAMNPSVLALEAGCRKLRRTSKFKPEIAEVLSAVAEAERTISTALSLIARLPERLDRAQSELVRLEKLSAEQQRRGKEMRARVRALIKSGVNDFGAVLDRVPDVEAIEAVQREDGVRLKRQAPAVEVHDRSLLVSEKRRIAEQADHKRQQRAALEELNKVLIECGEPPLDIEAELARKRPKIPIPGKPEPAPVKAAGADGRVS